jgi:hypothetical protein
MFGFLDSRQRKTNSSDSLEFTQKNPNIHTLQSQGTDSRAVAGYNRQPVSELYINWGEFAAPLGRTYHRQDPNNKRISNVTCNLL